MTKKKSYFQFLALKREKSVKHSLRFTDCFQRDFWWSKSSGKLKPLNLKKWVDICKLIEKSGLGTLSFSTFNESMLTKLAWHIISNLQCRLPKVLAAKDTKLEIWPNSSLAPLSSFIKNSDAWKGILVGFNNLRQQVSWQLGNGHLIKTRIDEWVPTITGGIPHPKPLFEFKTWTFELTYPSYTPFPFSKTEW